MNSTQNRNPGPPTPSARRVLAYARAHVYNGIHELSLAQVHAVHDIVSAMARRDPGAVRLAAVEAQRLTEIPEAPKAGQVIAFPAAPPIDGQHRE